jgi:hypothetical protein
LIVAFLESYWWLPALAVLVAILVVPSIRIIGPTEVGLVTKRFALSKLPDDARLLSAANGNRPRSPCDGRGCSQKVICQENESFTMLVESKNSPESVQAEEYPAWNEPGQFLVLVRSEANERQYPS